MSNNSKTLIVADGRKDAELLAHDNDIPSENIWTPGDGRLSIDDDFRELLMLGRFEMEPEYAKDLLPGFTQCRTIRQRQVWRWLLRKAERGKA